VVAYSPIARGNAKSDAVLARVGQAHGKTAAQACLRWITQSASPPSAHQQGRAAVGEFRDFRFHVERYEMAEIGGLAHPGGRIINYAYSGTPKWD